MEQEPLQDVAPPPRLEEAAAGPPRARFERGRSSSAWVAVAVAALLTALKLLTGWFIGSIAMVASGVDSLMDTVTSGINLLAVRHAERPPDLHHSYGHGKAEALAGLFQALIISASAVALGITAVDKLLHPRPIHHQGWGIVVMLVALAATFGLIRYLRGAAARTNSLALRADAVHYETDLLTGVAVVAALVVYSFTGIVIFDPLFSLGLTGLILALAFRVGRQAVNQLMDRELPTSTRRAIIALIEHHYPSVHGFHELRTRMAGPSAFIEMHLEVDRGVSFEQAHAISEHIVEHIQNLLPQATVTIHADPVHKTEHQPR